MNKNSKLLLSLLSVFTVSATVKKQTIVFLCSGTISQITDQNYVLEVEPTSIPINRYRVSYKLINNVDNKVIYSKEYSKLDIETGFELSLPLEGHLTSEGVTISFDHFYSTTRVNKSGVIYPYKKETVDVSQYRSAAYVREGTFLTLKNGDVYTKETFDFTDLNEYISVSTNNRLDLSHLEFLYGCLHEFTCRNIYLRIKDHQNLFPKLNRFNGEVSLKMKFLQVKSLIILSIDEPLYVNTETLEMSSIEMDNYVLANTIYLPFGREEAILDDEIYILIEDAGMSSTDFTIPFVFYITNKYIGECYESDYCIIGGVKQ